MTNGMRMVVETSAIYPGQIEMKFVHEFRGVVVHVYADTLSEAIELAIAQFKDMQDGAVEELEKCGIVRFHPRVPETQGEPS